MVPNNRVRLGFGLTIGRVRLLYVLTTVIVLAELALGVVAYAHPTELCAPLVAAGLGVFGFASLDAFLRPRDETHGSAEMRRTAPAWACVPFACMLGASMWLHYSEWRKSLHDIHVVAQDLRKRAIQDASTWDPKLTADDLERPVALLVDIRFPVTATSSEAEVAAHKNFDELAHVVARELAAQGGDADEVHDRAERDTALGFALAIGIQAIFVMWVPLLLIVAIAKARNRLDDFTSEPTDPYRRSIYRRERRILGEEGRFFLTRFCFGVLLVLGTNYVFAPYGLRASYVMSLVNEHALPGHTSYTLWSTSFAQAPVIVVGFVGFLIYAFIGATQRFMQDDFDDRALVSLLVRGLIVILLSLALSASPINDTGSRLFVFLAGVFPVRALEAIAKRVNVGIDPEIEPATAKTFDALPSLDPAKVFVLRAAGIQSTYDLAATPIAAVAERVRFDPRLLGRAVDRALLVEAVGCDLVKQLDAFAITSASELVVAFDNTAPEGMEPALLQAAKRAAARLEHDKRVHAVREWIASSKVVT